MAKPGWYPDPEGRPGHYRHWDGARWGVSTTRAPGAPDPTKPNLSLVPVIVVIGLVVIALTAWGLVRLPPLSGLTDATTHSSPLPVQDDGPIRSTPAGLPSPSPLVDCPTVTPTAAAGAGRDRVVATGGGLAFDIPTGWEPSAYTVSRVLTDQAGAVRASPDGGSWISFLAVGEVGDLDGFGDIASAAHHVVDCHVTGGSFSGYDSHTVLESRATTVGGQDAWQVRVHATSTRAPGGGATFEAIAVDTGDADLSVFWGGIVDADPTGSDGLTTAVASLRTAR